MTKQAKTTTESNPGTLNMIPPHRPLELTLASKINNNKGRCRNLRQRPVMDRTSEADPVDINFVGLEPQLSDEVNIARRAALRGDQTERGRIKILISHVVDPEI